MEANPKFLAQPHNPSALTEARRRSGRRRIPVRASAMLLLTVSAAPLLVGCENPSVDEQSFISLEHAAQWIVDHECDDLGARQGEFGISMSGQPIQMTFKCDNGATFDIAQYADGSFKAKAIDQ